MSGERDDGTRHEAVGGVIRGLSRSLRPLLRAAARLPAVGRIPARPPRLPLRHVAKVSGRMATGADVFSTASTGSGSGGARLKSVVGTLVKNTVLGAAVFETFGAVVGRLASPEIATDGGAGELSRSDEYERASLGAHFSAGAAAGAVHAVLSTPLEVKPLARCAGVLPAMTIHHGLAHALLFGSYEAIKRPLLEETEDRLDGSEDVTHTVDSQHVAAVAVAGGLAGQIQHVASHYTEQWLGVAELESASGATRPARTTWQVPGPAWRATLGAFPASAVAFVAFEFGKAVWNSPQST